MTETPVVYVIDDDDAVRNSICALLRVYGFNTKSFPSASEFLSQADRLPYGVLITDLDMPGVTGEELQLRLLEARSSLSIIVVTGVADVKGTVRIMASGAITLLEKPFSDSELLAAVNLGFKRSRSLFDQLTQRASISQKLATLSEDEDEVLEGMITGKSIKSCARALNLSTRTVERRRKAILEKLEVDSVPQLAALVENLRATTPTQPARQV